MKLALLIAIVFQFANLPFLLENLEVNSQSL